MAKIIKDIMNIVEELAPIYLAEAWDNCGLLVGDERKEVKKLLVALEPSMENIDNAVKNDVDLIVTHHPLMMNKINKITSTTVEGEKLMKLIKNEIGLYCAHTNLDKAQEGLNFYLGKQLKLADIQVLSIEKSYEQLNVNNDQEFSIDYNTMGLGVIGSLKEKLTLAQFSKDIQKLLKLDYIHYVGDKGRMIKKVAIVTGSGFSELDKAIIKGADVFITGDIKYHNAQYAKEAGIALIDATHFGSENIVVELLGNIFNNKLSDVEILLDYTAKNPIQIL
ncbi:MAG: Nif3-like dinuclear metal center hexameric protein [Firmicutes bacterium HGW-Firmicutes-1]|jgi:dinuclear metal center YbgI/SA1388 family protein|nr:MAG: Nif3-like dinuclear metal center hexameric protein [Firmicutes bacterium HGW-Firmicutes-1]